MKSAVVILSLLAGLAQAGTHGRFVDHVNLRRRGNYTEPQTTLTVIATEVHTITSCAPTVTDCPAAAESDKSTMVVTDTVVLTTTVCPVKDASSISSAVVGDHSAKTTATVVPYPSVTSEAQGVATSDVVTEQTQTLTVGTGTEASVITTTISKTTKITITITEAMPTAPATTEEPTTTVTATRTSTTTITVARAETETASVTGQDVCGCTATVTVTAPASTVYITMGNEPSQTAAETPTPSGDDSGDDGDDSGDDGDCDEETSSLAPVTTIQSTVVVVPYPTGNGTVTSGYPKPTGFARLVR